MTRSRSNASHMTHEARLAEVGALLALGFRRWRQISQNGVAESGGAERACEPARASARAQESTP